MVMDSESTAKSAYRSGEAFTMRQNCFSPEAMAIFGRTTPGRLGLCLRNPSCELPQVVEEVTGYSVAAGSRGTLPDALDRRIDSWHPTAVFERLASHVYAPDRNVFVGARNNAVLGAKLVARHRQATVCWPAIIGKRRRQLRFSQNESFD
jgi:hypothetical protein